MTKLVINEHEKAPKEDVVKAGQLRSDDDTLVLIVGQYNDCFYAVVLKNPTEPDFETTSVEPLSEGSIIRLFPHVIENARITVDLNE